MEFDYLAIAIAAVVAFIISGLWYSVFGGRLSRLHPAYGEGGSPSASDAMVELIRNLVVATVVAGLATRLPVETWPDAILLGGALWVGFPLVLLAGSVYQRKGSGAAGGDPRRRLAAEAPRGDRDCERLAMRQRSMGWVRRAR